MPGSWVTTSLGTLESKICTWHLLNHQVIQDFPMTGLFLAHFPHYLKGLVYCRPYSSSAQGLLLDLPCGVAIGFHTYPHPRCASMVDSVYHPYPIAKTGKFHRGLSAMSTKTDSKVEIWHHNSLNSQLSVVLKIYLNNVCSTLYTYFSLKELAQTKELIVT